MPRYFFDIDHGTHAADDEGTDLANDDDARVQAIVFAGDYLSDRPAILCDSNCFSVAVRDERQAILLNVVVTVVDPGRPRD